MRVCVKTDVRTKKISKSARSRSAQGRCSSFSTPGRSQSQRHSLIVVLSLPQSHSSLPLLFPAGARMVGLLLVGPLLSSTRQSAPKTPPPPHSPISSPSFYITMGRPGGRGGAFSDTPRAPAESSAPVRFPHLYTYNSKILSFLAWRGADQSIKTTNSGLGGLSTPQPQPKPPARRQISFARARLQNTRPTQPNLPANPHPKPLPPSLYIAAAASLGLPNQNAQRLTAPSSCRSCRPRCPRRPRPSSFAGARG